ncbi:hypothetical protein ElyMa_005116200 [Elysia marginata]|uniref:Uncharacterized protein n=1 Tax=Elysia marginata TaxID=1093978 RepID=A0AAV4JIX1_9GAST|nr:hypothetical protein ElyMa_005116200 [Elysia marginata]
MRARPLCISYTLRKRFCLCIHRFFYFKSTSGAPHPPPSPTRGRRSPARRLLRQGYSGEGDPSPDRTSRLDSMGHTVLPSTIGRTGPKWHVDERLTVFLQANSPQPPGLLPFRLQVAPHGQQGAQ